ncbi:MAG: YncE family protein [Gaiellaceae bacterium]
MGPARLPLVSVLLAAALVGSAAGAAHAGLPSVKLTGAVSATPPAATPPRVGHERDDKRLHPGDARPDGKRSSQRRLKFVTRITGAIAPKSVVSSQTGLFFAQNMMYRHSITVYDRQFRLVRTIDDKVDLGRLGHGALGQARGAPVEAAFTPDGAHAYVSNYSMYGSGFGRAGGDTCTPGSGIHRSFVYRVDTARLRIDQAIRVGAVPKFLAVTPDGSRVLVSNWCTFDLSIINTDKGRQTARIPLGRYPRGIAIDADGRFAYIALMGTRDIARVNVETRRLTWLRGVGTSPRHIVLGPSGNFLYVTLNADGVVAKVRADTGRVVKRVTTGKAPRSMTIADDGESLYVVNYRSNTVSKVRTRDMRVLQTLRTNSLPIGITYDNATRQVWVSEYTGSIAVFKDR